MGRDKLQELVQSDEVEYHPRKEEPPSDDGKPRFPTIKVRKAINLQKIIKEAKR
jgi:hypothetical protein